MLPAYNVNYLYAWGFVAYMAISFYFLLNILIANIFNMFRARLEKKASKRIKGRIDNVATYLNQFKTKNHSTMNLDETKLFFSEIFDLDP